jgi:hypothetical protein
VPCPGAYSMARERANRAERPGSTGNDFKVCFFCGALNVVLTKECVICGWHGRFDFDPDSIRKAMQDLRMASENPGDYFASDETDLAEYLGASVRRPNRVIGWLRRFFTG